MHSFIENGSTTSPLGFEAAGMRAGLKKQADALDCALIYSAAPMNVAAAFTANAFCAAPVILGKQTLQSGAPIHAVFVNSGNANACTGQEGLANATKTAAAVADLLGCDPSQILVSSTGRIGVQLPMDVVLRGVELCAKAKNANGGLDAARAIMTTDTRAKSHAVQFATNQGVTVTVGGMAKGAGMIAPRLMPPAPPHATMLAYITTDAAVETTFLQACLTQGLQASFNRITVDGDTSTNDSVFLLANGAAKNRPIQDGHPDAQAFSEAVTAIMERLARDIVLDGEGATKFIRVIVDGAASKTEAHRCAKTIAESPLCKTAWFGGDPNWGRVLAAAGYADVAIASEHVRLDYDDVPIVRNGMDAGTAEARQEAVLNQDEFTVRLNLAAGTDSAEVWTCDLSYEYVKINADYHT